MNYKNRETKRIEKLKKIDELLNITVEEINNYTEEEINDLMKKFSSVIGMCSGYHGSMMNKGKVDIAIIYRKYIKMLEAKRRTIVKWYEDKIIYEEINRHV